MQGFIQVPLNEETRKYTVWIVRKSVFVYIDDVLIATDSIEEHLKGLREVFRRPRLADLKVRLAKCDFLKKPIVYLGNVLSKEGVRVNDDKVKAIVDFPSPSLRSKSLPSLRWLTSLDVL